MDTKPPDTAQHRSRPTLGLWIFRCALFAFIGLLGVLGILGIAPDLLGGANFMIAWPFCIFAALGLMRFGWSMHISQLQADYFVAIERERGGTGSGYNKMVLIVAIYAVVVVGGAILLGPYLYK